jgi:hypothetical protein
MYFRTVQTRVTLMALHFRENLFSKISLRRDLKIATAMVPRDGADVRSVTEDTHMHSYARPRARVACPYWP